MSDRSIDKATSEDIARLRANITATLFALAEVRKQIIQQTGIFDLTAYQLFKNVSTPNYDDFIPPDTELDGAALLKTILPSPPSGADIINIDKWISWGESLVGLIEKFWNLILLGKDYLVAAVGFFTYLGQMETIYNKIKPFEAKLIKNLADYERQLTDLLAQEQAALEYRREQVNRPLAAGEVVLYEGINFGGDVVSGQDYVSDVEIDATSVRMAADTGVTLYADECFNGASQDIPVSVPSLAGSKLNRALPRSAKTWAIAERPYRGHWAVKIVKVAAQGSPNAPADDLYLSVKPNADNVGILSVSQRVDVRETFDIHELAAMHDGRQQVSFGLTGVTFAPATKSKNLWSMAFDPLQKITYVQEEGYRCFSLMTEQKKWVRYSDDENQVFYLNDYYDERTIFTLAIRIADSEEQLGALDAGEVALYENPIYWGRVWVINSAYMNFHAIPGLANVVSSVRLGPATAATVYHEDASTTPPTLVREDIVSNVHDMRLSQVGDNAITAIRPWRTANPAEYGVRVSSTLNQDYEPNASRTAAADVTVYRTTIEVPPAIKSVRVWTTDTAAITIGTRVYSTDEDQAAPIEPVAGRIIVTMKAAKLTAPALKLQLDTMPVDERIVIHADHGAHERLLAMDATTLEKATDRRGQPLIPQPTDEHIPRSAVAEVIVGVVQATIPAAKRKQNSGGSGSNNGAMGKTYRLSFGQEGVAPSFSMVSTAEAGLSGTSMAVASSMGIGALGGFVEDLFHDISTWSQETFNEIIAKIEQGVELLITEIGDGFSVLIKGFENEVLKPLKEFVLTTVQAVAEFVEMVIEKIGVIIEEFIHWLRLLFEWDNFKKTQTVLVGMFDHAADTLKDLVLSAKAPVMGFFTDTKQLITAEIDGLIKDLGEKPEADPQTHQPPIDLQMPNVDDLYWLLDKIVSALNDAGIKFDIPHPAVSDEFKTLIKALENVFSDVTGSLIGVGEKLIGLLKDPATGKPIDPTVYFEKPQLFAAKILEIIEEIATAGLTVAEDLIVLVLDAIVFLISSIKDLLKKELEIPFLKDLFKKTVGIELSLLNVGTLLLAIPVTIVHKKPFDEDLNFVEQSRNGLIAFDNARRQSAPPQSPSRMAASTEVVRSAMAMQEGAEPPRAAQATKLTPPKGVPEAMKAINICAALAESTINAMLDALTMPEGASSGQLPSWAGAVAENPASYFEIASYVLGVLAWGADAPSGIFMTPHVHAFGNAGKDDGSADYWENVVWFYEGGGLVLDLFSLLYQSERLRRVDVLGVTLSTVYSTAQLGLVSKLTAKRPDSPAGNFEKFMGVWPGLTPWLRLHEVVEGTVGVSLVVLAILDQLAGLATFTTGIADLAS